MPAEIIDVFRDKSKEEPRPSERIRMRRYEKAKNCQLFESERVFDLSVTCDNCYRFYHGHCKEAPNNDVMFTPEEIEAFAKAEKEAEERIMTPEKRAKAFAKKAETCPNYKPDYDTEFRSCYRCKHIYEHCPDLPK